MPEFQNNIDLNVKAGADYTAQIFWWDDYDNPVPVIGPLRMDVRTMDDARRLVITCADTAINYADNARGYLSASDTSGLIEVFIPMWVTSRIEPGRYTYDLFANYRRTLDSDLRTPAWGQYHVRSVAAGTVTVYPNITEDPAPRVLDREPSEWPVD